MVTLTAQLYIAACLLVAALDIYIAIKVWDTYFAHKAEEELTQEDDQ